MLQKQLQREHKQFTLEHSRQIPLYCISMCRCPAQTFIAVGTMASGPCLLASEARLFQRQGPPSSEQGLLCETQLGKGCK